MDYQRDLAGLVVGFLIATVTTPVGVSGAVFLLPVQLSVLGVPVPQVTPTNLVYNLFAGPGALVRYVQRGELDWSLIGQITVGTAPGVVAGAVLRVYVVTDLTTFLLIAAAVPLPAGLIILRQTRQLHRQRRPSLPVVAAFAFVVGVVGGLYGIGGGSLLGPMLVGAGMAVTIVAPAALAATFLTSLLGVLTYAVLALVAHDAVSPDWTLGAASGVGGLLGGYLGAHLQPHLPERHLRRLLGLLAVGLATAYLIQAAT